MRDREHPPRSAYEIHLKSANQKLLSRAWRFREFLTLADMYLQVLITSGCDIYRKGLCPEGASVLLLFVTHGIIRGHESEAEAPSHHGFTQILRATSAGGRARVYKVRKKNIGARAAVCRQFACVEANEASQIKTGRRTGEFRLQARIARRDVRCRFRSVRSDPSRSASSSTLPRWKTSKCPAAWPLRALSNPRFSGQSPRSVVRAEHRRSLTAPRTRL